RRFEPWLWSHGELSEWSKEHDWKSSRPLSRPRGCESLALRHLLRYYWPIGHVVKTPPFHGGNTGSNPVRVTIIILLDKESTLQHIISIRRISSAGRAPALQAGGRRFEPCILHHIAGWSSLVARRAHNPKVASSNLAPATKILQFTALSNISIFSLTK